MKQNENTIALDISGERRQALITAVESEAFAFKGNLDENDNALIKKIRESENPLLVTEKDGKSMVSTLNFSVGLIQQNVHDFEKMNPDSDLPKECLKEIEESKVLQSMADEIKKQLLILELDRREPVPLSLTDCYHFEDWTPIDDVREGEIIETCIMLSPSKEDIDEMTRRIPSSALQVCAMGGKDDLDIYAFIKPDSTVRVEMRGYTTIDNERLPITDVEKIPLTASEQQAIVETFNVELAQHGIGLSDKNTEELSDLLYIKVDREYEKFITAMRECDTATAIESAYEIVWKDNINEYCANKTPDLTPRQYAALLSENNTLDSVYERWLKNEYATSYDDVGIVLGDTADVILRSMKTTIKEVECHIIDTWEDGDYSCTIGRSVDDASFCYASVSDGTITREYEYDYLPSRDKVVSDHINKLSEEDIDRHEAEFGADGSRVFSENSIFSKTQGIFVTIGDETVNCTITADCESLYYDIGYNPTRDTLGEAFYNGGESLFGNAECDYALVYVNIPDSNGNSEIIKLYAECSPDEVSNEGDSEKFLLKALEIVAEKVAKEWNIEIPYHTEETNLKKEPDVSQCKKEVSKKAKYDMEH